MKRLQEETMTKMAVLGRGSMRDKQKEEDLRLSNDPKYQHLHEELHVEITAFAPPAEAHARVAYALTEVRKYLIPDSNDDIRQEQMREMEILASSHGCGTDNLSLVNAMAAIAAANAGVTDPIKRAAAMSAATLRPPSAAATAAAGQGGLVAAALNPLQQQQLNSQFLRGAPVRGLPGMTTSPYLVRNPGLYGTEENLMEAAAASQAPGTTGDLSDSCVPHTLGSAPPPPSHETNPSSLIDSWHLQQQQQQQSLKSGSGTEHRSKYRQQASPYIRPT